MLNRFFSAAAVAATLLACTALNAGVIFTMEDTDASDKAAKPRLTTVKAQDAKVKVETQGLGSAVSTMIFDGDSGQMMMIDPKKRTYTVIDNEAIEKIAASMRQAQAQMEAALAQVPPAQREQMKKMMGGSMLGGSPEKAPEVSVKHTGDRKSTRLSSSHVKISYAVF